LQWGKGEGMEPEDVNPKGKKKKKKGKKRGTPFGGKIGGGERQSNRTCKSEEGEGALAISPKEKNSQCQSQIR